MRFGTAPILTNGSMSVTTYSNGVDLQQDWIYSIQANFSGVNAASVCGLGTLKLQVSNDNPSQLAQTGPSGQNPAANVQNWTDYTGSLASTTAVAGSSSFLWNALYPGYRWVRMAYVAASGTGIISAQFFGKGQ